MFTNFGNTVQYQIIVKSVQQLSCCYKQADGYRNRHTYTRHSESSKPIQDLILWLWCCWGFKSSGMQCCATGQVAQNVSKDHSTLLSQLKKKTAWLWRWWCYLQNTGDNSPSGTVSYPWRLESLVRTYFLLYIANVPIIASVKFAVVLLVLLEQLFWKLIFVCLPDWMLRSRFYQWHPIYRVDISQFSHWVLEKG